MRAQEVAALSHVPVNTVHDWARRDRLPSRKRGQHWFSIRAEVERWILDSTRPSATLKNGMSDTASHVTLVGDHAGDYVIQEERSDGTLLLAPDTSAQAIRRRLGVREATAAEIEAFMAEHRESMLPADDEG